jgi:hypothetical protein
MSAPKGRSARTKQVEQAPTGPAIWARQAATSGPSWGRTGSSPNRLRMSMRLRTRANRPTRGSRRTLKGRSSRAQLKAETATAVRTAAPPTRFRTAANAAARATRRTASRPAALREHARTADALRDGPTAIERRPTQTGANATRPLAARVEPARRHTRTASRRLFTIACRSEHTLRPKLRQLVRPSLETARSARMPPLVSAVRQEGCVAAEHRCAGAGRTRDPPLAGQSNSRVPFVPARARQVKGRPGTEACRGERPVAAITRPSTSGDGSQVGSRWRYKQATGKKNSMHPQPPSEMQH